MLPLWVAVRKKQANSSGVCGAVPGTAPGTIPGTLHQCDLLLLFQLKMLNHFAPFLNVIYASRL